MSEDQAKWPRYLLGPSEHYHALGVIGATFNLLEHRLLGLFLLYLGFNETTAWLFARLRDNRMRLDLLERAVSDKAETVEIQDAVHHFSAGFAECAENRNILMHSTTATLTDEGQVSLIFLKSQKTNALLINYFRMDLPALRRIADEINAFSAYGHGIFQHVTYHYREEELRGPFPIPAGGPLPDKPPLPQKMTPQEFPILEDAPHQPSPSAG